MHFLQTHTHTYVVWKITTRKKKYAISTQLELCLLPSLIRIVPKTVRFALLHVEKLPRSESN